MRPSLRVERTHGRLGYDEALIGTDPRVVVDVMQQLWTADAALRRFAKAGRLLVVYDCEGYLLIVDSVTERSRERIREVFATAPFPAVLAVWRSDQPRDDLTEQLEPFGWELGDRPRETRETTPAGAG